jgi:PAS domain S-box-containing protein
MLTGNTADSDVVLGLDAGANDYVTKPVDMPVLLARIRSQLLRQQAGRVQGEVEERYALAMLGSNDGLWDWRLDADDLYLSPRWKAVLGFGPHELPDHPASWLDRIHPHDLPKVRHEIDDHLAGATEQFVSEHRMREKTGAFRWVLARAVAVRDSEGHAHRLVGSLTDITSGKLADALTGIPNRMLFFDRLSRLIEHHRRFTDRQYAVIFLDLDHFKLVNDGLGHHVGDQLLVQAARRLESCLRSTDTLARLESPAAGEDSTCGSTVARLGGDEFAIILEAIHDDADAAIVAERIQTAFSRPFEVAGHPLFTSVSMGIATSRVGYTAPGDVLRDADIAMYRAKAAGRGRWEFFESSMREETLVRLQLETELRHALDRDEFLLHFQPIVSLSGSHQVTGVEALIRWQHPERGLVPPDAFVCIAEETGLIVPLGFWALECACRQLAAWRGANPALHALVMSVNVSPRQLMLPDLADRMIEIVGHVGVPATVIELEVTETSVMTDIALAGQTLSRLKAAGFRLAIDDFGTGHSSLSYLQLFPVDRLKLDRCFVQRSQSSEEAESIIRTIVTLARELRLEVVAEGITNTVVLAKMRAIECGYGQGTLFSAALPADAIGVLLATSAQGGWPARGNLLSA